MNNRAEGEATPFIVRQEQAQFICEVLNVYYPNITFIVPVGFSRTGCIHAITYEGGLEQSVQADIYNSINVLTIAYGIKLKER